jgi:hypothetical protein
MSDFDADAQTGTETAITRRVVGKPFAKGSSGNPGGRGKGIARYIREQTKNGEELIDLLLECARGELVTKRAKTLEDGTSFMTEYYPSCRDRLDALKFLVERGLGSELESVSPENEAAGALAVYTSTQLLAVFDRVRQLPADAPAKSDDSLDETESDRRSPR